LQRYSKMGIASSQFNSLSQKASKPQDIGKA
jgi:hypothetical protein